MISQGHRGGRGQLRVSPRPPGSLVLMPNHAALTLAHSLLSEAECYGGNMEEKGLT